MSPNQPPEIPYWICGDCNGAFPKGQIYGSLCFTCAKGNIGASFQLGEINISLKDLLNRIFSDERYSPTSRPKYINTGGGTNSDPDSDDELDLSLMAVCSACHVVDSRSEFFESLCANCAETRAHNLFKPGEVRMSISDLLHEVYLGCDLLSTRAERARPQAGCTGPSLQESWDNLPAEDRLAVCKDNLKQKQASTHVDDAWLDVDKNDTPQKGKGWVGRTLNVSRAGLNLGLSTV
ncbi:hypothetical protein B0T18DRAFT_395130 [Schizothecium vesticola]|uniref:Uncharacterized protein n=1 Tax=Schizothecium vesticola TaxID=314040 RepID=A0AA40BR79_9PEZI|nr:hypothetical protein B0T18DRAFT_395130 [Schizothecium vesticola]